jgi:hypothetical protein
VTQSISIHPSLTGYISKGIALSGKGHVREARAAFDVASMFTNQDSKATHFLFLIKVYQNHLVYPLLHLAFQAIALFNADQHEEAMLLVKELAAAFPKADRLGCRVVEVSVLRRHLVIDADPCNFHIRHTYVFSSELKPRVTMKLPITSLPPSTPALSHQHSFI